EVVGELEAEPGLGRGLLALVDGEGLGHGDAFVAVEEVKGVALGLEGAGASAAVDLVGAEVDALVRDVAVPMDLPNSLPVGGGREIHITAAPLGDVLEPGRPIPPHAR